MARSKRSIVSKGNQSRGRIVGAGMKHLRRLIAFGFEAPLTAPRRFMPRAVARLGILGSLALFGCATTVRPGLANVPALSTSPVADDRVHDVIANGWDSCELGLGAGPLRHQFPPCPGVEPPAPTPVVVRVAPPGKGLVLPWVEHFYARWPCSSPENEANRVRLARPESPHTASDRGLSLSCAEPL